MANIDTYLNQIKNGVYGRDVRNAIHDAINAVNQSIPTSTSVSQEVISARTPGNVGLPPYDNLKQRLDEESENLITQATQLSAPGNRANIQINNAITGYSSLKDKLDSLKQYTDERVASSTATATSQEVINARAPGNGLPAYNSLKERLDTEAEDLQNYAEQMARPGTAASIQIANATVGYSSLANRLDTLKDYADEAAASGRTAKLQIDNATRGHLDLDTRLNYIEDRIDLAQSESSEEYLALGTELDEAKQDINAIRSDIDEQIPTLETKYESLNAKDVEHDDKLDELDGRITSVDDQLLNIGSQIESLDFAVTGASSEIISQSQMDKDIIKHVDIVKDWFSSGTPGQILQRESGSRDNLYGYVSEHVFNLNNSEFNEYKVIQNPGPNLFLGLRLDAVYGINESWKTAFISRIRIDFYNDNTLIKTVKANDLICATYRIAPVSLEVAVDSPIALVENNDAYVVSLVSDQGVVPFDYYTIDGEMVKNQNLFYPVPVPEGCTQYKIHKDSGGVDVEYVVKLYAFELRLVPTVSWIDNPPVDDTLSVSGQPADAKTVGDLISSLSAWQKEGTENQILSKDSAGLKWIDNPPVDTTLTVPNQPADAAAVGEIIRSHDARITSAATNAATALNNTGTLNSTVQDHDEIIDEMSTQLNEMSTNIESFINDYRLDEDAGTVTFLHDDMELFTIPWGGGGGGGSSSATVNMTSRITTGWVTKNTTLKDIEVTFEWSSTEDGNETGPGSVTVATNGFSRTTPIEQGQASAMILGEWLHVDKNSVTLTIQDSLGNTRRHPITIYGRELMISSTLDTKDPIYGELVVPYTPVGKMPKVIHFVLDGVEQDTVTTSASDSAMEYRIPQQEAGVHSLEIYAIGTVSGEQIESNHLYYEIIWLDEYSTKPMITVSHQGGTIGQFFPVNIPWRVYSPNAEVADVDISVDGAVVQSLKNVNRNEQTFNYVFERYDDPEDETDVTTVSFMAAGMLAPKTITFRVTPSEVQVEAETTGLELYLDSKGRSNNEENWNAWKYGNIEAQFSGFNKYFDGWQTDDEGQVVLRVAEGARVYIPFMPFSSSFLSTGRTISVEFTSRGVVDFEAPIISCMSGGKGFLITPNMMRFSTGTEVWQRYNENSHIRADFVFDANTYAPIAGEEPERLIKLFINGVWSRTVRYKPGEITNQTNPVGITIGADGAGVDIYCIRVYNRALTDRQVERNWVADTRDPVLRVERYYANDIFDSHGDVTPDTLKDETPYAIMTMPELPTSKEDKKTGTLEVVNKLKPTLSAIMQSIKFAGQGTSSMAYWLKNISAKSSGETIFINGSSTGVKNYGLTPTSIPFNSWVFKVDMASSEGTNNVIGVEIYNRFCPYKTPEMLQDSRIRWGIEGYAMVLFYRNLQNEIGYYAKANFNLPKRAPGPLGYPDDDEQLANTNIPSRLESWEIETNNTSNVKFQTADFTGEAWKKDFEARIPDEYFVTDKIKYFAERVSSTNREAATGEEFATPEVYVIDNIAPLRVYTQEEGKFTYTENNGQYTVTCTHDTPARRLIKFRAEAPTYMQMNAWCWYYDETYSILGTDSYAKNLFIGFRGDPVTDANVKMYFYRKAVPEPYDMDTIFGINNSGFLTYSPFLTDTDRVESNISGGEAGADGKTNVWQAQDSVLMTNIRDAFPDLCRSVLAEAIAAGYTADTVIKMMRDHRTPWSAALKNYDSFFKYVTPMLKPLTWNEEQQQYIRDDTYLNMLQGDKDSHMEWFVRNRFRFVHSQYTVGSAESNFLRFRIYNEATIGLYYTKPIFGGMRFGEGGENQVKRVSTDLSPVTFEYKPGTTVTNFECRVFSGDLIKKITGLAETMPNEVNVVYGLSLEELVVSDETQNVNLNQFSISNSPHLKTLKVRNCPNLRDDIDLEKSVELNYAAFDGSGVTEVRLAEGCQIETLILPGTITHLVLRHLPNLSTFTIPTYENVEAFMLAGVDEAVVNPFTVLNTLNADTAINLEGINMTANSATDIDTFYAKLDTMRGVTREKLANGTWRYVYDEEDPENPGTRKFLKAQVSGTIHIGNARGNDVAKWTSAYPGIVIDADHTEATLTYKTYDGSAVIATETVLDGGNGTGINNTARESTVQYNYTPDGWATEPNGSKNANALNNVVADRIVYAAYITEPVMYTVVFANASSGQSVALQTTSYAYGQIPVYSGAVPVYGGYGDPSDFVFNGWSSPITTVTDNTTYTAVFEDVGVKTPTATTADGAYGVEWNYNSSSSALTRKGLASDFSAPIPATNLTDVGSSPFDTIEPWASMKMYNIVNGNVLYSQDDAEFNTVTYDTVVYIPEFYYTVYKDETNKKMLWAISPVKLDGYEKHPGSGRYISKYHVSGSYQEIYTRSGNAPLTQTSISQFRQYSRNKGSNWRVLDFATWSALLMLYLIEFAHFNSQSMLGYGYSVGTIGTCGGTDGSAYHTIKRTNEHNSYRYVEDPFSNVFDFLDGFRCKQYKAYAHAKSSEYSGDLSDLRDLDITMSSTTGYIKEFAYSPKAAWAFIPLRGKGSNSTYVPDTYSAQSSNTISGVTVGGKYTKDNDWGFFHFFASGNIEDKKSDAMSTRMMYIP